MNDEVIHAYALIGLRALAEYDFNEFKRSTDLTKGRLDDRINELLGQTHGQEREDLNRQLDQLESIRHESENQVAAAFLRVRSAWRARSVHRPLLSDTSVRLSWEFERAAAALPSMLLPFTIGHRLGTMNICVWV